MSFMGSFKNYFSCVCTSVQEQGWVLWFALLNYTILTFFFFLILHSSYIVNKINCLYNKDNKITQY